MGSIEEVKKKREFSGLPDSIVGKALAICDDDVKKARALLRKYFGVFLTNRVLKGRRGLLGLHISSKGRDYQKFYSEIFSPGEDVDSVVDLGCGINGFSYPYMREVLGSVDYVGVEAIGQLVDKMNFYFRENDFSAEAVVGDLFDVDFVLGLLRRQKKRRVVFLFQVVDALEGLERDFSKNFLLKISGECEKIILSFSLRSLSGRKRFESKRKWMVDFFRENFLVEKDFVLGEERIIILKNKI